MSASRMTDRITNRTHPNMRHTRDEEASVSYGRRCRCDRLDGRRPPGATWARRWRPRWRRTAIGRRTAFRQPVSVGKPRFLHEPFAVNEPTFRLASKYAAQCAVAPDDTLDTSQYQAEHSDNSPQHASKRTVHATEYTFNSSKYEAQYAIGASGYAIEAVDRNTAKPTSHHWRSAGLPAIAFRPQRLASFARQSSFSASFGAESRQDLWSGERSLSRLRAETVHARLVPARYIPIAEHSRRCNTSCSAPRRR